MTPVVDPCPPRGSTVTAGTDNPQDSVALVVVVGQMIYSAVSASIVTLDARANGASVAVQSPPA